MNTDGTALIEQESPAAQPLAGLVKRLGAYLGALEIPESGRSEIIGRVLGKLQRESAEPTMARAMAELHVLLGQTQTVAGPASVRASAAQRAAMWFDGAPHQGAVDTSFYLKRPRIKRMAMLPEKRPQAMGTWRRLMRLHVGQ